MQKDTTAKSSLDLSTSPQAFFKDQIDIAQKNLHFRCDAEVEFYIVNLLVDFIEPSKIDQTLKNVEGEGGTLGKPLAFILKEAMDSPPEKKAEILRRLGDVSLYISGFFQDYFNRKSFDMSYYVLLGASAYDELSVLQPTRSSTYAQLAKDFVKHVDLIAEVSDHFNLSPNSGLLQMYERWSTTGSKRLEAKIMQQGIIPLPIKLKIAQ